MTFAPITLHSLPIYFSVSYQSFDSCLWIWCWLCDSTYLRLLGGLVSSINKLWKIKNLRPILPWGNKAEESHIYIKITNEEIQTGWLHLWMDENKGLVDKYFLSICSMLIIIPLCHLLFSFLYVYVCLISTIRL